MRCGLSVRNTCCTNTQRKKQHVSCIKTFQRNPDGIPRPALLYIDPPCCEGFCLKIFQRKNAFQVLTPQSVDTQMNLMVTLLSSDWLTKNLNTWSNLKLFGPDILETGGRTWVVLKTREQTQRYPHPLVGQNRGMPYPSIGWNGDPRPTMVWPAASWETYLAT